MMRRVESCDHTGVRKNIICPESTRSESVKHCGGGVRGPACVSCALYGWILCIRVH